MFGSFRRAASARAGARAIRSLALVGTGLTSLAAPAYAEKVVFNGTGDFSATRTDTLTDTAQVVDVRTTTGNLGLNFSNLQAASATNGSALYATTSTAGAINVTTGIVNVTGTNQTNGVYLQGANGNITLVAGTTTANTNNADRAINVTTPIGNITITSTMASGSVRAISTSDGTGAALPNGITTINSGTATVNGTGQVNPIVAQGATVNVTSDTASITNAASNGGAGIFVQSGAGGATVKSTTVNLTGLNQAGIQVNELANGAVSIDSGTVAATQSVTAIRSDTTSGSGATTIKSATINLAGTSTGIEVDAGTGTNSITSGTISASAASDTGILVNAGIGATTIASDVINFTGAGSYGISVNGGANGTGAISITSNKINSTQQAIQTSFNGGTSGAVAVNSTAITGSGSGINLSNNGQIDLTSGSIALTATAGTTTASMNSLQGLGISVTGSGTQATTITSGSIVYTGTGNSSGITLQAVGGGAGTINSGTVTTTGNGGYGVLGLTSSGALTIASTGNVTTVGTTRAAGGSTAQANQRYADGIDALSDTGSITVSNAGTVSTAGVNARGIEVEAGKVRTTFSTPSGATSTAAIAVANTGTVKTTGGAANGINVLGDNNPITLVSNVVSTTGTNSRGINVVAQGGSVNVTSGTVTTAGTGAVGISVFNGAGNATVNGGTVTTAAANGLAVNASGIATVGATNVSAAGDGQSGAFLTGGTGIVLTGGTFATSGSSTSARRADAISATATAGTISGTVDAVSTTGNGADAIRATATSATGGVTLNVGNAKTSGVVSFGVNVFGGAGNVALTTGTVSTSGAGSQAVFAQTTTGNITLNAGTTTTTATALSGQNTSDAVFGYASDVGGVTINSVVASTSADSSNAVGAVGGGVISVTSGTAATNGANTSSIYAYGRNNAAVSINATTTTATGSGAYAVEGHAVGGNLTIVSGTATTKNGIGVFGTAGGVANVTATNTTVAGDGQAAVYVTGGTGVTLNVGSASSTGAIINPGAATGSGTTATAIGGGTADVRRADAVFAQATNGTIVANVGSASATGLGADAVHLIANGTGGGVTLNVTGAVSATQGYGVFIDPPGANAVTIASGASVAGSTAGLNLVGATNSVVNNGTISSSAGPAILASGATSLSNAGTITATNGAAVQLGSTDDTVTLRTGSVVNGTIVGGGGNDAAVLVGTSSTATASQTLATFSGFNTLTVQSGYWTAGANAGAFNSATIASGASFEEANGANGIVGITTPAIVDNGTFVVRSSAASAGSAFGSTLVTGTGGVLFTGSGTATLAGTNSLQNTGTNVVDTGSTLLVTGTQGGTFVNNGTVQIGNGGTTGLLTGTLVDNGTANFNRSDDYTFTGAVTGAGTINKLGAGKLTFGTNFAFTGVTNIVAGSVKLSTPVAANTELDVEGSGQLDLSGTTQQVAELAGNSTTASVNIAGGSLTDSQSTSTAFAGSIVGNGSLTKSGSGRLNLTGTNTYTGPTTVAGGTLSVNGSIVSPVTVTSGGTLGGNGSVGSVTIASGGTFAPGNSIGTTTVNGNVAFAAGSTYQVEANAAGQADRINATGTASLAGTLRVLADPTGTYANLTNYTILTAAGGVSGSFTTASSSLAFLTPLVNYSTNAVTLTLARNDISFSAIANTANQASVGAAVQSRGLGNPLYNYVLGQTAAGSRAAFTALSGEIHATVPTILLDEGQEISRAVLSQARAGGEGLGIWGQAMYGQIESAARQGVASSQTDRRGGLAGLSYGREGFRFGAAGGYLKSDIGLNNRASHADVDTKLATAFVSWSHGPLMLDGGVAYAWQSVHTRRTLDTGVIGGLQTAHYDAHTAEGFGEASYGFTFGNATFAPFVGYAHLRTHREGFAETGSAAALTVARSNRDLDVLQAGGRLEGTAPLGSMTLLPHLSASYQRLFGNTLGIENATFAGNGLGFSAVGARTGKDVGRIEAGADLQATSRVRIGTSAFGQSSGALADYGVRASLSIQF